MRIRPMKPEDKDQLVDLLETRPEIDRRGAEQRAELQQWVAFQNPAANGEPTYYCIERKGKLVAFHGRMPAPFWIHGADRQGYFVHDLYVHPEERRRGKGFWYTRALAKAIEAESHSFFCLLGMTELNLAMQQRMGYHTIPLSAYVKFLRPRELVQRLTRGRLSRHALGPFLAAALRGVDRGIQALTRKSLEVEEIPRFDEQFTAFWQIVRPARGIFLQRSAAYLNWRYVDRPYPKDRLFIARGSDGIAGYMVLGYLPEDRYRKGLIKEIIVAPGNEEAVTALIAQAITSFKSQRAVSIRCMSSNPDVTNVLRRHLFWQIPEQKIMLVGNLHRCASLRPTLEAPQNWQLTPSASDLYMLSHRVPRM